MNDLQDGYQLTPDVGNVQFFIIGIAGCALVIVVGAWAIVAAGATDAITAALITVFIAFGATALCVGYARARFGSIRVDPAGLILRVGLADQTYGWENIQSLEQALPYGRTLPIVRFVVGPASKNGYVVVRLRRSARVGFLLFSGGTEATGIPFGVKTLRLGTPTPDRVIAAAEPYVREARGRLEP